MLQPRILEQHRILSLPAPEEVWWADDATRTEGSEQLEERLDGLAAQLNYVDGADPSGIEFVEGVERFIPQYKALYGNWGSGGSSATRSTAMFLCRREAT